MVDYSGRDIGRYHIIRPLGTGGMAVVYQAFDERLEREVAVKVIRIEEFAPSLLERVLQRFEREAKTLARLNHTNIVPIIDFGQEDNLPYLVMPLFQGGTLANFLGAPMPAAQAARLLTPLADALAYAHGKGVLHRDIKPSNILINETGQPMLTDFGIAKLLEGEHGQTLTGTGVGIGTPEYMAPEQGMGREVDARADIYALGVVLYELVTGQKPYSADTPMAVVIKQINDPLPRPRDLNAAIPEACEQLLFKALAKEPANRYGTMEAMRDALSRLAEGRADAAPGPLPTAAPESPTMEYFGGEHTVELGTGLKPSAPVMEMPASPYATGVQIPGEPLAAASAAAAPAAPSVQSIMAEKHRLRLTPWGWVLMGVGIASILFPTVMTITYDGFSSYLQLIGSIFYPSRLVYIVIAALMVLPVYGLISSSRKQSRPILYGALLLAGAALWALIGIFWF